MRIDGDAKNYAAKYIRAAKAAASNKTKSNKGKKDEDHGDVEIKDSAVITEDAKKKALEAQKEYLDKEAESRKRGGIEPMDMKEYKEQLENAKEQGEAAAEMFEEYLMCVKIALRIISGDNVPLKDHRFLAEKEPDMYSRAVSVKLEKKDPEDHDRLSEDEEEETEGSEAHEEAVRGLDAMPKASAPEASPAPAVEGDVSDS